MICASPHYLRRRATPRTIEDLKDHDCLLYGADRAVSWIVNMGGLPKAIPMSGVYRTNNGKLIRDAAGAALGLAQLPDFIIGDSLRPGELVAILDKYAHSAGAADIVHPAHRQRSGTDRALTDYLAAHFQILRIPDAR